MAEPRVKLVSHRSGLHLPRRSVLSALHAWARSPTIVTDCADTIIRVFPGPKPTPTARKLCLFATYDPQGLIDPYVLFHLKEIARAGFDIILISTSAQLEKRDLNAVLPLCRAVVHRRNIGLDFASWKVGIELTGGCAGYDRILLTNDSIFGPLRELSPILQTFESSNARICGLTESLEITKHLQSYFLYVKLDSIPLDVWDAFWNDVEPLASKNDIIERYEVGLSQRFLQAGIELMSYICRDKVEAAARSLGSDFAYTHFWNKLPMNNTLFMWDLLIQKFNFPYVKRDVFQRDLFRARALVTWRDVVSQHALNPVTPLIENYLRRMPILSEAPSLPYERI